MINNDKNNIALLNYKSICKNEGICYFAYSDRYSNIKVQPFHDEIPNIDDISGYLK